jgi:anaerobic selenocysteine-containing dehydrogenase
MAVKVIASTCKECSVRCGSLIHVDGEQVVKIEGNPAHPASRGAFCIKGVHGPVTARNHPDRPLHPMRRKAGRGEGQWERISWAEAYDEIAKRMADIKRAHGVLSLAGAVSNHFVSRGVAMTQLLRSLGTPNYMINQDLCQGARYTAALLTGAGAQSGNEMEKARCILVVGKSPSDSSVVQWMNIKAAKKAGATLIVIDPRRTPIARQAARWLAPRPGTDAALALAMVHVILEENLQDREFVEQWCVGVDRLRERARRYAPPAAAEITGIAAEDIVHAARTFATVKPGCMVLGHGIDAQANGVKTAMAFHALLALTGNIDRPGTNRPAKPMKGFKDYYSVINDRKFRLPLEIEQRIIGGDRYPLWCGPDSWSKSSHNPSLIAAMHTGEPYPVKALYVSGVNIACTYPDIRSTVAALRKLDLLVVATDHMTPTAELADFVLPKTTLLEEEDVSADQGAPCVAVVQRALPPRGEAKCDMEIAIGLRDALRRYGAIDYDVFPWNSHREFIDYQLRETGVTFDDICKDGYVGIPYAYEDYRKKGFKTPSGKIELASDRLSAIGQDPLPDYHPPVYAKPNSEYDLTLLTGIRSMAYHHSRFRNHGWARRVQDAPELRINPRTAQRLGIAEDDWAWVDTPDRKGRVLMQAWLTEEVSENIVATGMGWWFPEMSGSDRGSLTYNIDAAVAYGPPWDPICGAPEARNTACRVTRAAPEEVPPRAASSTVEVAR